MGVDQSANELSQTRGPASKTNAPNSLAPTGRQMNMELRDSPTGAFHSNGHLDVY